MRVEVELGGRRELPSLLRERKAFDVSRPEPDRLTSCGRAVQWGPVNESAFVNKYRVWHGGRPLTEWHDIDALFMCKGDTFSITVNLRFPEGGKGLPPFVEIHHHPMQRINV